MAEENIGKMPKGHMERYHPHGIEEGDSCKYIFGGTGKAHFTEREKSDRYYSDFSFSHEVEEAENTLLKEVGAQCFYPPTNESLRYIFGADVLTAELLCLAGNPIGREQYEHNICVFYEICMALKQNNPKFNLGKTLLFGWDLYEVRKWYASSTLDKRLHVRTRYISLGDISKVNNLYNRSLDAERHLVRHEIGHNLATQEIVEEFKQVIPKTGSKEWIEFKEAVLKFPNKAARQDGEEAIAETFAVVTDPFYKKGSLPEYLENIVHKMLSPNEMQKGVVMDSGISQTALLNINPIYLLKFDNIPEPPEDKIAWYDQKSGKYRIFKTHDEMMRTVLPIFQIQEEDIQRILQAKKNEGRKWDSWDISMILMDWLYLGKSIEEIIERN